MGLKCSLLGHNFGEPEVEREREERGDEVVLISRETETCSRCGEERVVSENKEVTTVQPEEAVGETEIESDATEGTPPQPDTGPEPGGEAETGAGGLESAIEQVEADEEFETPEEDDAVILGEEEESEEREPGEWPEEEGETAEAGTAVEAEAEAEPDIEQAPEPDVSEAEPEPSPEAEDAEVWAGGMPEEESTSEPAGPSLSTGTESSVDTESIPEGSFYCPECGFTEPIAGSSLRAGDACPDCHRGYLERKTD